MTNAITTKRNADGSIVGKATGIRVFDLIVDVEGFLEGKLEDWPPQVQDPILEALERLKDRVQLPLTVIDSAFRIDQGGANDGSQDKIFIHVIVSEIVVGDDRFVRDSKREAMQIVSQMMKDKKGTRH